MLSLHQRYALSASISLFFVVYVVFSWRTTFVHKPQERPLLEPLTSPEKENPPYPVYKKPSHAVPPIVDNFPLALAAHSAAELPPIPRWNIPRSPHVPERTPLFIGFTRNWRVMQQVVVSFITAGWPPQDIYVVENTGVMDANKLGQLSLQNPFFLNHTRLDMLGVNVIITPTLLTFAQLQNFYLWTSIIESYPYYFWSHMDIAVVSAERRFVEEHPDLDINDPKINYYGYKSLYDDALEALYEVLAAKDQRWAMRFFSYDRLTLVNVTTFRDVGGWDTQIPFYMTDCDMHARLEMEGYNIEDKPAGYIWDVGSGLDDLIVLYRKKTGPGGRKIAEASFTDPNALYDRLEAEKELQNSGMKLPRASSSRDADKDAEKRDSNAPTKPPATADEWEDDRSNSELYKQLVSTLDRMQSSKAEGKRGRNTWQVRQMGGEGDPFYRDSEGFEQAIQMAIGHGRAVFSEKWGHRDCDIVVKGLKPKDAWRVEHDW